MVSTPTDLDELDRLRAAATPGKLFMDTYHHSDGAISYDLSIGDYEALGVIREPSNPDTPEHGNRKSLAELIVALVNAYPALAAELRELRETAYERGFADGSRLQHSYAMRGGRGLYDGTKP